MAPQGIIHDHKLESAQSKGGHARQAGRCVSFVIDQASILSNNLGSDHDDKVNNTTGMISKSQLKKSPLKNALRNARKRAARVQRRNATKAQSGEATQKVVATQNTSTTSKVIKTSVVKTNQAFVITQIMIGSMPINLTTTASPHVVTQIGINVTKEEMVTLTKGKCEVLKRHEAHNLKPLQQALTANMTSSRSQTVKFISTSHNAGMEEKDAAMRLGAIQTQKVVGAFQAKTQQGASLVFQVKPRPYTWPMEAPKWFKQNMDIKSEAMSVMMTNTATLEEQMKQLQRRLAEAEAGALLLQAEKEVQAKRRADAEAKATEQLAEKDTEIAELVAKFALLTKEKEKKKEADEEPKKTHSNSVSLQDIKTMIADGIKELQLSLNPPISGYLKPYPSHYDALPFPKGYLKPTFDKFDGVNSSPHEHLAHFYSAYGEASQVDALLLRQFVQSLK